MNDTAQIIIAIATLITSLGSVIVSLLNRGTINSVKTQTDGVMITLEKVARSEGVTQGRAEGKAEEIQFQRDKTT